MSTIFFYFSPHLDYFDDLHWLETQFQFGRTLHLTLKNELFDCSSTWIWIDWNKPGTTNWWSIQYLLLARRRNRFLNFLSNDEPDCSNSLLMRHSEAVVYRSIRSSRSFNSIFQAFISSLYLCWRWMEIMLHRNCYFEKTKKIVFHRINMIFV